MTRRLAQGPKRPARKIHAVALLRVCQQVDLRNTYCRERVEPHLTEQEFAPCGCYLLIRQTLQWQRKIVRTWKESKSEGSERSSRRRRKHPELKMTQQTVPRSEIDRYCVISSRKSFFTNPGAVVCTLTPSNSSEVWIQHRRCTRSAHHREFLSHCRC